MRVASLHYFAVFLYDSRANVAELIRVIHVAADSILEAKSLALKQVQFPEVIKRL